MSNERTTEIDGDAAPRDPKVESSGNDESSGQAITDVAEKAEDQPSEDAPKRSLRPRFTMLSMMLFAGVVCVWSMYIRLRQVNPKLEARIEEMEVFSMRLDLTDVQKISIARQLPSWYDESIWQVRIPEGQTYVLKVATRDIRPRFAGGDEPPGAPPAKDQTTLKAGTYKIALVQEKVSDKENRVLVIIDDQTAMVVKEEGKDWDPGHGSSGGAMFDRPSQPERDEDLALFRRRFMMPSGKNGYSAPEGPTNGIELWLEKNKAAESAESPADR